MPPPPADRDPQEFRGGTVEYNPTAATLSPTGGPAREKQIVSGDDFHPSVVHQLRQLLAPR